MKRRRIVQSCRLSKQPLVLFPYVAPCSLTENEEIRQSVVCLDILHTHVSHAHPVRAVNQYTHLT